MQRWVEDIVAECMLDGFANAGESVALHAPDKTTVVVTRQDGKVAHQTQNTKEHASTSVFTLPLRLSCLYNFPTFLLFA